MTSTKFVFGVALVLAGGMQIGAQSPIVTAPGLSVRLGTSPIPRRMPGTTNGISTIQGNALNSSSGPLPDNLVRLRDARSGRIVATQISDKAGLFEFKVPDPGSYIIEIVNPADSSVLAASQLINVNAGEVLSAVVKLPFRSVPLGGAFGQSVPQMVLVTASAAASGVLATVITRTAEPVSP
jgi:hypothetical protein